MWQIGADFKGRTAAAASRKEGSVYAFIFTIPFIYTTLFYAFFFFSWSSSKPYIFIYIFSPSYFLFIFSNCLFLPADCHSVCIFLSVSHLLLESTFAFFTACSQQQPFDFFLLKPLCFQVFSKELKQNKLTQVLIHYYIKSVRVLKKSHTFSETKWLKC